MSELDRRVARDAQLKRDFGIGIDQYHIILDSQGGVCAICGGDSNGRGDYHVDHDHRTMVIRGVLCARCNLLLGYAKDSPDILRMAISYLENRAADFDAQPLDDSDLGDVENG